MEFTDEYPEGSFSNYELYLSETPPFTLADTADTAFDKNNKFEMNTNTTILPGGTYYMGVSAVFSNGNSNIVTLGPITTLATQAVPQITSLALLTAGLNNINVQWDEYTETGTGTFQFKFYISTSPSKPSTPTFSSNTMSLTEYDFTGLTENTRYYIWVVTSFGSDNSEAVALSANTAKQV
jgi:hypothetical protein